MEIADALKLFDARYASRALQVFEGRNRRVYHLGKYVVKIPRHECGIADNEWEGSVRTSKKPNEWNLIYPPHKRLVWLDNIPVLFMQYVEHANYSQIRERLGRVPPWVDRVDCGQVGFNKNGLLVAYDYGIR